MTEYETAALNLGYWQMMGTFLQASLGFVIGVIQCGLIYIGLKRMGQSSEDRKSQHEETMEAMRSQHEATMHALDIQREASAVHGEALRELIARTAK